jgi:hypothetical protein
VKSLLAVVVFAIPVAAFCFLIYTGHPFAAIIPALILLSMKVSLK